MGGVTAEERTALLINEVRCCLWCDAVLVQKEGETKDNFRKRRYCDKRHKSLHQGDMRGRQKRHMNCSLSTANV